MSDVVVPLAPSALPRRRYATADVVVQLGVIALILLAWEVATRFSLVDPFLMPAPEDVLARIRDDALSGALFTDLAQTLYRAVAGFLVSAILGVPLGILMARNAAVRWFFDPLISVGFPMPKIAFLPIFILWFDLFDTSKIIMIVFSCVFPIVTTTYAGTLGIDKWPVWSARSLGATPMAILHEIVLPMALPQVLTGLQIALPTALITDIVTEMMMGGQGVGAAMMTAGRFADSVGVFAGIVEIGLLGAVLVKGMELMRRRLLVWHPEARR